MIFLFLFKTRLATYLFYKYFNKNKFDYKKAGPVTFHLDTKLYGSTAKL